jgi:hypothetical protein
MDMGATGISTTTQFGVGGKIFIAEGHQDPICCQKGAEGNNTV